MDVKEYWPSFISEIKEFKKIDVAENMEIDDLKDSFKKIYENQFFSTMDELTIARLEKIAGITPMASESLEIRRNRLISLFFNSYTFNRYWLECKLNATLGYGKHKHVIEDDLLGIVTNTNEIDSIKSLRKEIRKDIPATMEMHISLERASTNHMNVGVVTRIAKVSTIIPSNKVTINTSNRSELYVGACMRVAKIVTIGGN